MRRNRRKHNLEGLKVLKKLKAGYFISKLSSGLTLPEIAKALGVSRCAVANRFKAVGVSNRNLAEAQINRCNNYHPNPKATQRQLILGSLLGDACLYRQQHRSKAGTRFSTLKVLFAHGRKQLPYLKHKRNIMLKAWSGHGPKLTSKITTRKKGSNLGLPVSQFAFSHTPTLEEFASMCHDETDRKRVTKKWADQITAEGMAYWYQDDGSISYKKGKTAALYFFTNSFSKEELEILKNLSRRFGFTYIGETSCNKHKKHQKVLRVHRWKEIIRFLKKIKPFITPCLKYKIRCLGT